MRTAPTGQRWWISPPRPDESLRSLVLRVAALYECSASTIWECLNKDEACPSGDMDLPSCIALRRMGAAIGIRPSTLLAHRQADAQWLLAPSARNIYCPSCWSEDQQRGFPYSIRRSWNWVLRTTCPEHGEPLRLAPDDWNISSTFVVRSIPSLTNREEGVLDLIERFGESLEQSLYFGAAWPAAWGIGAHSARQLLLEMSFNVNTVRDYPQTKFVRASGNLQELIRGPKHQEEPAAKPLTWDRYRHITDPAIRRAGLWSAAWALVPDLPEELSPGWATLPSHIELYRRRARRD